MLFLPLLFLPCVCRIKKLNHVERFEVVSSAPTSSLLAMWGFQALSLNASCWFTSETSFKPSLEVSVSYEHKANAVDVVLTAPNELICDPWTSIQPLLPTIAPAAAAAEVSGVPLRLLVPARIRGGSAARRGTPAGHGAAGVLWVRLSQTCGMWCTSVAHSPCWCGLPPLTA